MPEIVGDLQYSVRVDFTDADAGIANYDKKVEAKRKQWERPIRMSFDGRGGTGGGSGGGAGSPRGRGDIERDYNLRDSARRAERVDRSWDASALAQQRLEERATAKVAADKLRTSQRVDRSWEQSGLAQQKMEERATERAATAKVRFANDLDQARFRFQLSDAGSPSAKAALYRERAAAMGGEETPEGLNLLSSANELEGRGAESNRLFGVRVGRLAQYATYGFAAIEAGRIGAAYQQRGIGEMLAGKDQAKALDAQEEFSRSLLSTPIIGPLAGVLTGAQKSLGADDAQRQAAAAIDANTEQRRASWEYRNKLVEQGSLANLGADSVSARRLEITQDRDRTIRQNEDQKRTAAQAYTNQQDQERTSLVAAVAADTNFGLNRESADRNRRKLAADTDALAAFDAGSFGDKKKFNTKADADQASEDKSAREIAVEQNRELDSSLTATDIRLRSSINASNRRGANDPFGASIDELSGSTLSNAAKATTTQKQQVLAEGLAKLGAFFEETGRNLTYETRDVQSRNRASGLTRAGYGFAGSIETINAERDRQLRSLPDNYVFNNFLGGNELRRSINAGADQQVAIAGDYDQRRSIAAQTGIRSATYRLSNHPLDAQIADIQGGFDARNVGRSNFSLESIQDRIKTAIDVQNARKDFGQQTTDIEEDLNTRKQQIAFGLRRDPVGAEVAGIVGEGKTEARQLARSGRVDDANQSIQNSIGSLNLVKQNYLDAFRGTAIDLRLMDTTNPRDSQNPNVVLKDINDGIADLRGTNVGDKSGPNGNSDALLKTISDGIQSLLTAFTNITTQ